MKGNYLYIAAFLLGLVTFAVWFAEQRDDFVRLTSSLVLMAMGIVRILHVNHQVKISLAIRYLLGVVILLIALFRVSTLFMWGVGAFVIATAIIDTIWPSNRKKQKSESV